MPIVEKVEKDDTTYNFTRPGPDQLDNENSRKQLKDIESAREAALKQKRSRQTRHSGPAPAPESGFKPPIYDQKHGCWKTQSQNDPNEVRVWDESKNVWRSKDSNSKLCKIHFATQRFTRTLGLSNTSGTALLDQSQRKASWFRSLWRRPSVWATTLFGK